MLDTSLFLILCPCVNTEVCLQETTAGTVPPVQLLCSTLAPPLLLGYSLPLLHRALQRGTPLHRGTPQAAGGQPASPRASPQAAGDFCSGAWSTSPPPSSLTLASARLSLTPLSLPAAVPQQVFCFALLQSALTEAQTILLIGPAPASGKALP